MRVLLGVMCGGVVECDVCVGVLWGVKCGGVVGCDV